MGLLDFAVVQLLGFGNEALEISVIIFLVPHADLFAVQFAVPLVVLQMFLQHLRVRGVLYRSSRDFT